MKSKQNEAHQLLNTVIENNCCIGCGACTAVSNSPFQIKLDRYGQYQATLKNLTSQEKDSEVLAVCPFSDEALDEDKIGRELYSQDGVYDPWIGYHLATYAGYVVEKNFRAVGSSGGIGKWILYELLRLKLVDAIIQVKPRKVKQNSPEEVLYTYQVFQSVDDIKKGSKSAYYPVEMSQVLNYVRENPGRYAITGIPCFIKAIRLLSKQEPIFLDRIIFCIGIICGHLKSTKYAEMIGWQREIQPGKLQAIDFRKKIPEAQAREKGVELHGISEQQPKIVVEKVRQFVGTDYNHGFFKYNACNFCDDVVGETADISIGDAWLPEYYEDGKGTSIVVTRNLEIQKIVQNAIAEGRLYLDILTKEKIVESQSGGFRDRREGLAYRLYLADKVGQWRPNKRIKPQARHLSRTRQKIYELRVEIAKRSHQSYQEALDKNDFSHFQKEAIKLIEKYQKLYFLTPLRVKIYRKLRSLLKNIITGCFQYFGYQLNKTENKYCLFKIKEKSHEA